MRILRTLLATTALAAGLITVSAPGASAERIPESTIKRECKEANNGSYATRVQGGVRSSSCLYTDNDGNFYIDHYKNGRYTGSGGPY